MGDDTLDPANREIYAAEALQEAWDTLKNPRDWYDIPAQQGAVLLAALRRWRATR